MYIYTYIFYYFIGIIEPKLRSVLLCTQLIACVRTKSREVWFGNGTKAIYQRYEQTVEGW